MTRYVEVVTVQGDDYVEAEEVVDAGTMSWVEYLEQWLMPETIEDTLAYRGSETWETIWDSTGTVVPETIGGYVLAVDTRYCIATLWADVSL